MVKCKYVQTMTQKKEKGKSIYLFIICKRNKKNQIIFNQLIWYEDERLVLFILFDNLV